MLKRCEKLKEINIYENELLRINEAHRPKE
jgi:hypothetical protein